MLCSATGMMLMTSANDLVTIFLSLEILSIALYVLAAFDRRRVTSQEAGLKYFLLGSFSSAVFLYGVALVYGGTGTTNLTGIADFLATTTLLHDGVLLLGIAFLIVGLGFKVAAAPFHMWTPDVYQGAPTPVTAFMAAATKAAAFAAVLRVLVGSFSLYSVDWRPIIWVLAVLSLLVGSIAAVVQTDVKRMLAYSSITHAGFVLIAVQAATAKGTSAALFYVLTYAVMTIGAFAVVGVVARKGDDEHALTDYRGLAGRQPVLAGVLTLFLLAQAGVPLTGGFVAKLSVFSAAVSEHQYVLALVGMLASVIAAFVYLRIVLAMYAPADDEEQPRPRHAPGRPRDPHRAHALGRRRALPRHRALGHARLRQARHPAPRSLGGDLAAAAEAEAAALRGRDPRDRGLVERLVGELVRGVDQLARAREVEQVARIRRAGEHDHLDLGRHEPQLELEALAARVGEARHHDVERRAFGPIRHAPDETFSTKTRSTGPASACESGTLSTTPPSTRRRPSWWTIGNTPGSAVLASSAGLSGPRTSTTSSPVSRSVAITRSGISRSERSGRACCVG